MNSESELFSRFASLLPARGEQTHKGDFGTLTVIAGSRRFRGAASLAVEAALRSGCGIVRLAAIEPVAAAAAAAVREAVFLPLPEGRDGGIAAGALTPIPRELTGSRAILAGCGMGDTSDTAAAVGTLLSGVDVPLVLDADALNALKYEPDRLREAATPPILTPHVGEAARLLGRSADAVRRDRAAAASEAAARFRAVVVLKDYETVIASPEGLLSVCELPNSGLARGGSGDVLAGLISSFLAQGQAPAKAAELGVLLHALAGQEARRSLTARAMLPSDLIASLPAVFRRAEEIAGR